MKYTGNVAIVGGRVTMKIGKQDRWITAGGKKVKISPDQSLYNPKVGASQHGSKKMGKDEALANQLAERVMQGDTWTPESATRKLVEMIEGEQASQAAGKTTVVTTLRGAELEGYSRDLITVALRNLGADNGGQKMAKQGEGRWATIGGKKVKIEPSGWTERKGGKLPKGVLHRKDYDHYLELMEESRQLLRNGETKDADKAYELAEATLSASKTKEGEVPEYLAQQKEEHARRRARNKPLEIKRMVKQEDGKWITIGGKKVKVGAKGSGKKKTKQKKSGKVPDSALDPSKKLAREADTFEDFERSLGTLTGHQYIPGEVDEKYYGRKGVKQFYEEFHIGDD